jgi:branched-chain amino acid transport system permease protein
VSNQQSSLSEVASTRVPPPAGVPRTSSTIRAAVVGIFLLTAITAAFVAGGSSYYLFIFNSCLLAAFGSLSLNLLMGTAGAVSLGNAAFLAVGAFCSVFFLRVGIPFPGDVLLAGVVSCAVGVVIGLPALRLRGLQLALATLAAFFVVTYFANQYESAASGDGTGFVINPLYNSYGLVGGQRYLAWTLLAALSVLILLFSRLSNERLGRAWRTIRDHETIAPALGIPVTRYKLMAFAISSAVIGVEGGLAAHVAGVVDVSQYTLVVAISYVAMVLIGGLDSMAGAVIGAAVVTALPLVMPNILSGPLGYQNAATKGPGISEIAYGALVVIFIVSSPRGIIGFLDHIWKIPIAARVKRRIIG